jgi:hypothetical protein
MDGCYLRRGGKRGGGVSIYWELRYVMCLWWCETIPTMTCDFPYRKTKKTFDS